MLNKKQLYFYAIKKKLEESIDYDVSKEISILSDLSDSLKPLFTELAEKAVTLINNYAKQKYKKMKEDLAKPSSTKIIFTKQPQYKKNK